MTESINYDRIAPHYDRFRRAKGPYSQLLWDIAAPYRNGRFLELGPGTGNETQAMMEAVRSRIVGLERSWGMCGQARDKRIGADWVQGAAEHLPFDAAAFDFAFGAYMLHYLPDLPKVCFECRRVLRPGAAVAFVTVSHAFIRAHPMNHYFPSLAAVDLARFPDIARVLAALKEAGFQGVTATNTVDRPKPIDAAYVQKVANRFISTYDLLPANEFARGLSALSHDVATGDIKLVMAREATLVWGFVPDA